MDNNYDGLVDCDDWSCKGRSPCPAGEICGDALDNDADELADCEDPDCAGAPSCWTGTDGGFDLVLSAKGYRREGEKNVVEVDLGDDADVEVVTLVVPFPGPQSEGVQGWSVSVAHNQQVVRADFESGGAVSGRTLSRLRAAALEGIAFQCGDLERTALELARRGVSLSGIRPGRKPGSLVATVKSHCLGIPTLFLQPG